MRGGARAATAAVAVLLFAGFIALGTWQVERRAWKLDLIERVEQRVHAPAVAAPGPASWPTVSAARDEYRHVRVSGTFLHDRETLVQAVTTLGAGFWVLTPLRQSHDGHVVLVNRGFVPPEARERAARSAMEPAGETSVTGLLRMTEPKGGFLRSNDAAGGRWYSRDVQAIAAARGLADVAPYFIDADGTPAAGERDWPVGGLTVIRFQNNHLVYALTWYALALMVAAAAWRVWREQKRRGKAAAR
ncbi:SURF1 family protein [Variovorax robiniae]|uniref:SURF1-like protein n=1 Tax=Variovorax robiniae TaxID=1836199 RepID=A0ABU8X217_9BURK